MKKLLLIISLLLSLQIQAQKGLTLGGQLGINLTNVRVIKEDAKEMYFASASVFGGNVNVYLKSQSSGVLGISAEPGIIQKGYELDGYASSEDLHYKLRYVTLPVLINFKIVKKLSIGIGPEASYLIWAQINNFKHNKSNPIGRYERFDIAGMGGLDCEIVPRIAVALRYSYGLSVVERLIGSDSVGNQKGLIKTYNTAFQLSLRYNFIKPD